LKLKVEINTREHEVLFGYRRYPFQVASDWYSACVFRTIVTDRFGSVTAEFGNVTDDFGNVTGRTLVAA